MAIYHFSVSVLSRARGHRIVASAALQAAAKLRDDYYGIVHDHEGRAGVEYTAILAPDDAPSWAFDREKLWNRVEAGERRRDSQLARAVEIGLPTELTHAQRVELLLDFVSSEFVARGMIADVGIRRSKLEHPNASLLLTLRAPTAAGFGPKMRQWNGKNNLVTWRASWASRANVHLARAGHRTRIDHRTLDEQQIELTPARKTGIGRPLGDIEALPEHLRARLSEQRGIAHANGLAIIEDPAIAIRALAQQSRVFTIADLGSFLRSRTDGAAQHQAALSCVMASPELTALEIDEGGPGQYTSRDLIEAEKSLLRRAHSLAARRSRALATAPAPTPNDWSQSLCEAFQFAVGPGDFKAIALFREERRALLEGVREHWHARASRVVEYASLPLEPALSADDVVVVEDAEMVDLKSLERILAVVERARAKVLLAADASQLQAMGALSPMHGLLEIGPYPIDSRA